MRVAVIGAGIAGLGAAWLLRQRYAVTVFEAGPRAGGHANTLVVHPPTAPSSLTVDTGFIVCNQATYPNLLALFRHLGVALHPSDMSFSLSLQNGRSEYCSDGVVGMLGHWQNLLSVPHWQMLRDLLRFYQSAPRETHNPSETLGQYIARMGYSSAFVRRHLLPMAAAIWSGRAETILDFPVQAFVSFYQNHSLFELDVRKRSPWLTVAGGSREYVKKLVADACCAVHTNQPVKRVKTKQGQNQQQVQLQLADGSEALFDAVVLACQADTALALLAEPTDYFPVLGQFSYQDNPTILHRDVGQMPKRRGLWASWNYRLRDTHDERPAQVTYWMNRLQPLPPQYPLLVTLNSQGEIAPDKIYATINYRHPQLTSAAFAAQTAIGTLQGKNNVWFCGSYLGFGFHEDGLASGLAVAESMGCQRPWVVTQEKSPAYANSRQHKS